METVGRFALTGALCVGLGTACLLAIIAASAIAVREEIRVRCCGSCE